MEYKTLVLNSELEFRKHIINNSKNICQILLFEDTFDNTIFFYCFYKDRTIVSTKEKSNDNFKYFYELYRLLNFGCDILIPEKYKDKKILVLKN